MAHVGIAQKAPKCIKWNVLKYIWSSFVYFTQMRPRELAYVKHMILPGSIRDLSCSGERLKVAFDNYFSSTLAQKRQRDELLGYGKFLIKLIG